MNWDIAIGQCRQIVGRGLQAWGRRTRRSRLVSNGEGIERAGRLQLRYGVLKHQVQWNSGLIEIRRRAPNDGTRLRSGKGRPT